MKVRYNNTIYHYPSSAHDVSVGDLIRYHEMYGRANNDRLQEIELIEDETERDVETSKLILQSYAQSFSFHTGIPLDEVGKCIDVGDMCDIYVQNLEQSLKDKPTNYSREIDWDGDIYCLGDYQLLPQHDRILDEFLTSKEAIRQLSVNKASSWEKLKYLSCIYLRKKGEPFTENLLQPDGDRMQIMDKLPASIAQQVGIFFDQHNTYLKDNFSVFGRSKSKGIDMQSLFDRWGWVSFLSVIAKDGVFNISGLNAIDSAKQSKLYDVLIYASEKKDREELIAEYYESIKPK